LVGCFVRSLVVSFVHWLVRWLFGSLDLSLVGWLVRSFVRSFARSLVRWYVDGTVAYTVVSPAAVTAHNTSCTPKQLLPYYDQKRSFVLI